MKLLAHDRPFSRRRGRSVLNKRLLLMNLTSLLLLVAALPVAARSYSQKVSLSGRDLPIEKVLEVFHKQTGYEFIYDETFLEASPKISVNIRNKPLEEALQICFSGQGISWFIKYGTVVIKKAHAESPPPASMELPPRPPVHGTVTDTTGKGLAGVSVVIKGTRRGVMTNDAGEFELKNVAEDAVLVFSAQGYQQQEIRVSGRVNIQIQLSVLTTSLDALVIVGYSTQKKVDLTGSVSSVSGDVLNLKPVGQTSSALEGLLPGVTVTQRTGRPGGDAGTIRVRGIGTLDFNNTGKNEPLVLIDGAEGSMNNIDPNVIASVTVLKDAASASIYGSRAANGVILVTTKRAKGSRLSINYNDYFGWQKATGLPQIVDATDHMLLTNEAYVNAGRSPLYSNDLIQKYRNQGDESSDSLPNTDWQKAVLTGSGFQESHFLTLSGGSDKIRMLASVGYFDQKGIIENAEFKRLTVRNNVDWILSRKFNIQFDLQYVSPVTTEPSVTSGTIFHWMNGIPPTQLAVNSNGTWGEGWNGQNPMAASRVGGVSSSSGPYGSINAVVNYKPFDWLDANFTISPKYAETHGNTFKRVVQTYHPDGTTSFASPQLSSLSVSDSRAFYNNMRALVTLHKSFGPHNVKLMGGAEENSYHNDNFSAYRDTYVLPDYPILNGGAATNMSNGGSAEEWALRSFFGRLNYDYKEKYLLEINARDDGSSRFASGHQWGFFPSVSAGWRLSEEGFLQSLRNTITEMKLRGSWGRLGNQNIGTYPFVTSVALGSYSIGGNTVSVAALNDLANPNITWETTEMSDVGLDLTLWSHLTITGDYYIKKTKDILLQLNIPLIIGLNAPYQNAGRVDNKGWEVAVNYDGKAGDFKYNIGVNLSDVHNKVIDMHGINQTTTTASREGYPINSLFGYQAEGYFTDAADVAKHAKQFGTVAPGDIKFRDQNGDGVINQNDKVVLGNTIPRYTYGVNANLAWKGFDLGVMLQGVGKADGMIYGAGIMPFYVSDIGGTVQERFKDHWTPDHTNAAFPRLVFGESNNQQISSFWKKNAAYMRLKNLQVGYSLSPKVAQAMHIQSLRIFANGANLFTKDKFWKGYDVESNVGEASDYPIVKVYSFGINVNF